MGLTGKAHFVRRSMQYAHPSRTSPTDISKEGTSQLIRPATAPNPHPPQPILILIVSRLLPDIQKGTVFICKGCHKEVPQIEWLKQQKCIVSQFWRLKVWDQGVGRVGSFWGWEGESAPCLSPGFWWLAGNLWRSSTCKSSLHLCLHLHVAFSLCVVSVSKFPFI